MERDFRILSIKEEKKLSSEELKEYYERLREYILNRKLTNTTPGAAKIGPKLKKTTNKIAIAVTKAFTNKNIEWIVDGQENILDEGAAIYAYTHQGILDNFVWLPDIKQHSVILHGQEVNKLLLLCQVNTGLVLVKKGDKENNNNAKLDMIKLLLNGTSVTYFPEGTWNLSPNKLHLPLSFGFLDTAKKAKVPVIPAVLEYCYDEMGNITKIHTRYGKPIYVKEEDDLLEKLEEYKAAISTMRYEILEENGVYERTLISNEEYINFLKKSKKNLKLGKLNWQKETENIFGANDPFYDFHAINEVEYDENGNLLETKEARKIKELAMKNGI